MKLEIISPEKTLYSGEAELVTLPGASGSFTILKDHAPIISVLTKGKLLYRNAGGDTELLIDGGFVEMKNNTIEVCVD
ncbi:MAG: ATP synthase F1 subunit epsilon [Dysgonamonadaceae bacterium]|jgi:F-type H+-transporting ATPase subunit epsilon|nr:ATP synthase F1 subunit epsilon [Dysgonamonadaceae bacterium]